MVDLRKRKAEDIDFIFDSWLQSWRKNRYAGTIPNNMYYEVQRCLIEDLLARGAMVVVACSPRDIDDIYGWACAECKDNRTVLHYLHTKAGSPPDTIDRLLSALPGLQPGFITHKLSDKRFAAWRHAPEIARRKVL